MKTISIVSQILLLLALSSSCISTQSSKETNLKVQTIKELVGKKSFTISTTRMYPQRGKSYDANQGYYLKIEKDSVYSYLPYFGVTYSTPYSGENALHFDAAMKDYVKTIGKKGEYNIDFSVSTPVDNMKFSLKIFDNGSSSIFVQPVNRQSISYSGEIDLE